MRIEFLGTGGYHPSEHRHTACLLLPELGIAFDAGSAAFRLAGRTETNELDLFLSHAHLDHVMGLTFLLVPVINKQYDRLTVHGTQETLAAVREHIFAERIFPVAPPFECREIEPTGELTLRDGSITIRWQPLPSHPGGSTAYRVDHTDPDGIARSLAYVTDTRADRSYLELIDSVDLLIHECYFADGREALAERTGHSCASEVAATARDANAKRLALVHLDPYNTAHDPVGLPVMRKIFPHTQIAVDGMSIEI